MSEQRNAELMKVARVVAQDATAFLARQIIAGELLAIRREWATAAEKQRNAGLEGAADLSVECAGQLADLFRQLTGRHPGEVE